MKKLVITSLVAFAACAYKPSAELVRAQEAYRQAANGPTADIAQAELHQAKNALDQAQKADKADPGSGDAKDLAYIAERKAEWARAQATQKIAMKDRSDAEKKFVEGQGAMIAEQQKRLAEQGDTLGKKEEELSKLQSSAAEAQALAAAAAEREKEALAKLKAAEDSRGQVVTLPSGMLFRSGQSVLLPAARPKLDEVAAALRQMPERTLLIEGHTDAQGSEETNLMLSERRANAVRDYLIRKGVESDRIQTQGAGESRPLADNGSAEGRAINRRVEIVIQGQSSVEREARTNQ